MSTQINSTVVKRMLGLAKLGNNYSEQELEKLAEELGSILEYVEELKEIDTSTVNSTTIIPTCKISDLRTDIPNDNSDKYQKVRQNIINNFPKKQGDLLVLPIKVVQ